MPRSSGTYTAPSNSFNPAVQGETADPDDWNATLTDVETALTASVYTDGLGSTDNRIVRTDGSDGKKIDAATVQIGGAGANEIAGVAHMRLNSYTVSGLPTGASGMIAYASNGRKNGEGGGAGTGVLVFHDSVAWRACDTGATVAA